MVHLEIKSHLAFELCDYKTFLAANLNRHVKAVHNKHNVDPITHDCGHCGKKFKAQHNLRRHAKSVYKMELGPWPY